MFPHWCILFYILVLPFCVGVFITRKVGFLLGGGCNGTRYLSIGGYSSYLFLEYFGPLDIYPIGIVVLVPVR